MYLLINNPLKYRKTVFAGEKSNIKHNLNAVCVISHVKHYAGIEQLCRLSERTGHKPVPLPGVDTTAK